jgi:hypothetical protein
MMITLAFIFALEAGWLPHGGFIMYEAPAFVDGTGSYYVDLQAEAEFFEHLYVGGGMKAMMWSQEKNWTFWPHTMLYNFGAGLRLGPIEIGWRHFCVHPVLPYMILFDPHLKAEGSWDEVFARVQAKIPVQRRKGK